MAAMKNELLQKRLNVAQTQLLLDNMRVHSLAALLLATLVFLFLSQMYYVAVLLPWYILVICATAIRLFFALKYQKLPSDELEAPAVVNILAGITFLCGALWGSLSLIYIGPDNSTLNFIILMLYTGLVANASVSLGSDLRAYLSLIVPLLVPTAVKLFSLSEPVYQWFGLLLMVYSIVCIISTGKIRASLERASILHLVNDDLIKDLQTQVHKTQAALAKAESANRAKSRFFAAANHDLRQPLQSLSMFTTTLSTQSEHHHQKRIVSNIEKSVRSLESLFNRLLDVSTLDAGTIKVRKRNVRLKPFIEELATEFVEVAGKRCLSFEVDVADDIVFTDSILLGRIVRNIIDNAVHYTNTGGIKIVSITNDSQVQLSVIDSGIGISNEQQELVFEEFVQLNNPGRDRNKGLGLGLSIVRRCCELLDLPLSIDSAESKGTSFTIDLPVGESVDIVYHDTGAEAEAEAVSMSLKSMFVLVIDDEEDIRLSMESLLSVWGCTVMVASSGLEAVQQLIEFESIPDAIITDYRLQNNETGADALQLIMDQCKQDIPAIVITGDISADRLVDIDKLGIPVLHKPCNSAELFDCLHNAKVNAKVNAKSLVSVS